MFEEKSMNILKKILLVTSGALLAPALDARELVDEMVAQVNKTIICKSDVDERQLHLGGNSRSLEECIQDELLYQKAKTYNAVMSEEDLEKRLVAVREGYGFGYKTHEEFEAFVRKTGGLSVKRLREQLKRTGAVATLENVLIPRDALVLREDVEAYCAQHPLQKDEEYLLSFATLSKDDLALDGSISADFPLVWTELDGWIRKSDLASHMKFVVDMKVGEVSKPALKDSACFVYRLEKKAEKRPLSVDERYAEVEQLLLKGQKAKKEIEVKQRLRDEAAVVIL